MLYNGIPVIASKSLTELTVGVWCKSKKKRIRKKWAKNPKNLTKRVPSSRVYMIAGNMYAHPVTIEKMKIALKNHDE